MPNNTFYQSVGRRKEAIARVRVLPGNSQMTVNGKPISEVFKGPVLQKRYQKPLEITKSVNEYTASVKVTGGGQFAQLDAIVHGLSRSLSKISPDYRRILKAQGLLTRDPRAKERRKYGLAHAARAKKQSPKR